MAALVIIRGNSGSGKTTVARALQKQLGKNVMLLSQDVIRREILRVNDGRDNLALPLLKELLTYGRKHCEYVILEGILHSGWYASLFALATELYGEQIVAYYYDIPFEETLKRHMTKSNRDEFGEVQMRQWWNEKDFIGYIPEYAISKDMSIEETVLMIYRDLMEKA